MSFSVGRGIAALTIRGERPANGNEGHGGPRTVAKDCRGDGDLRDADSWGQD